MFFAMLKTILQPNGQIIDLDKVQALGPPLSPCQNTVSNTSHQYNLQKPLWYTLTTKYDLESHRPPHSVSRTLKFRKLNGRFAGVLTIASTCIVGHHFKIIRRCGLDCWASLRYSLAQLLEQQLTPLSAKLEVLKSCLINCYVVIGMSKPIPDRGTSTYLVKSFLKLLLLNYFWFIYSIHTERYATLIP